MTESGLKLMFWVVAASLAGAMLAIPQAVDPWELPSLVLDRAASSDAIRLDETLAKEAPGSKEAQTLRSLFLDHGRAEAQPPYETLAFDQRQADIYRASKALVEEHGLPAFGAMRARAVEEFAEVFAKGSGEPQDEYETGVLGGFLEILRQYGVLYRGELIAPELTIRSLYKARWNSIHRRPFVEGFSPIELQSYWGWFSLHAWGKPLAKREDALLAFHEAGGYGAQEAAALFDVLGGRPDRAAKSLETLYAASGELRLRNLSLGALHASLFPRGAP